VPTETITQAGLRECRPDKPLRLLVSLLPGPLNIENVYLPYFSDDHFEEPLEHFDGFTTGRGMVGIKVAVPQVGQRIARLCEDRAPVRLV
jgi:hypothetical protein